MEESCSKQLGQGSNGNQDAGWRPRGHMDIAKKARRAGSLGVSKGGREAGGTDEAEEIEEVM